MTYQSLRMITEGNNCISEGIIIVTFAYNSMAYLRVGLVFISLIIISFLLGNCQYSATNYISVNSCLRAVSIDEVIFIVSS